MIEYHEGAEEAHKYDSDEQIDDPNKLSSIKLRASMKKRDSQVRALQAAQEQKGLFASLVQEVKGMFNQEPRSTSKLVLAQGNDFADSYIEVTKTEGQKVTANVVWKLRNP